MTSPSATEPAAADDSILELPILIAWLGRFAGPVAAAIVFFVLPSGEEGLSHSARATAAIGTLMGIWWMSEAWPIAVTSLLPIVLFPLTGVYTADLTPGDSVQHKHLHFRGELVAREKIEGSPKPHWRVKIAGPQEPREERLYPAAELQKLPEGKPIERAAAPYADPFVFLYLAGFLLALSMERWNLHRRIALHTLLFFGTRPAQLLAGFMAATAAISMWMSNTATTALMLPIALSVANLMADLMRKSRGEDPPDDAGENNTHDPFATSLMLSIAYAATIGGLGTLVGTPTNMYLAGFLKDRGVEIDFVAWMAIGVPLMLALLLIMWLLFTQWLFPTSNEEIPGGRHILELELADLGPMSRGEITSVAVFLCTALLWMTRVPLTEWPWLVQHAPWIKVLDDPLIGIAGALILFVIPVDLKAGEFALDWKMAHKLPWDMLLLFGGGLSLAQAITATGLDDFIGVQVNAIGGMPPFVALMAVTAIVVFASEITSNVATNAALLPILFAAAPRLGLPPLQISICCTLAASCSFMLPVATPPNTLVFGTGKITTRQMIGAGYWLNMVSIVLIPLLLTILGPVLFP